MITKTTRTPTLGLSSQIRNAVAVRISNTLSHAFQVFGHETTPLRIGPADRIGVSPDGFPIANGYDQLGQFGSSYLTDTTIPNFPIRCRALECAEVHRITKLPSSGRAVDTEWYPSAVRTVDCVIHL